ncbi:hypothetical protein F5Y10DRAFT_237365 [Nemania abortiva]|nr:hypothetical protein F5Y10DRAFT_237365 [Nemania abortiva]
MRWGFPVWVSPLDFLFLFPPGLANSSVFFRVALVADHMQRIPFPVGPVFIVYPKPASGFCVLAVRICTQKRCQ